MIGVRVQLYVYLEESSHMDFVDIWILSHHNDVLT